MPAAMHMVPTRSGFGPAMVENVVRTPVLSITYYVPTPKWMIADGIVTKPMVRCDWVGYINRCKR